MKSEKSVSVYLTRSGGVVTLRDVGDIQVDFGILKVLAADGTLVGGFAAQEWAHFEVTVS